MYLRELDLVGFKSFAQKSSLVLDKGVSAIVGPNGCGKSNIGDAIRWVLGEQRMRVLRGQHMEDIIFGGSDDRNPLGMAEATLVLDNTDAKLPLDYAEVSVTRRLFRSGESEYLINKLPCRRKDIIELFMGTGIGADSYSLIEQGRIDLVLSSKPEERRYIFEDAAGIIKYKSRKNSAIRKMDRTEANLLRLQDTIIEVRRRINSLRRQANAAQRYRKFQEQLRSLDLRLALLKYRELDAEHGELAVQVKELNDRLQEANAVFASRESEVEKTRFTLLETEKALSHSQDQSRDFKSQIEKRESQIALLRERVSSIDEREKRDVAEIDGLKRSLEAMERDREIMFEKERKALEQATQAQQELNRKETQLIQLNGKLDMCERHIEELRSLSLEKMNRRIKLQNEVVGIENTLHELSRRKAKLSEQKTQAEKSLTQHENRLSETRNMITSLRAALASLSSEITSVIETITARESELESSLASRDSIRDSLSAARSKLSSLEELRDKFEGYEDGVRALMLSEQAGVLGPLADLIHAHKEHEAAVEAALGERLQHIVVEDIDVARRCVGLLASGDAGRASLIPLSSFSPNGRNAEPLLAAEGVMGKAIDMVRCAERYRPIADALLGTTIVVDSLDNALIVASSLETHHDIVTLKGEVVSSLGIITAGNAGHGRGLIGRKNEIEELTASIREMTAASEAEGTRITNLKREIDHQNELLQKLRSSVNSYEVELAKAERDLQQLEDGKKRDKEEFDVLSQEYSLVEHETQELTKQRQELQQQIEHAKKVETETLKKVEEETARSVTLREHKDSLSTEISDSKVSVSSLQLTSQTFKHELARLDAQVQEANRRISEKQKDIEEGSQAKKGFVGEIDECRSAIQETFEQKRSLDSEITKLVEKRDKLSEAIRILDENLKKTRTEAQEMNDQHHQSEITLAQIEEKLSFLKERTLNDYRLSMSEIAEEITIEDDFDPQAAEEEAGILRNKIEAMGAVNLIAIEEFEELQQRYEFLIQQETDLRKANETLLGIIKKIDEVTQGMFLTTFKEIQSNFHDIFRELFGGGRASLQLMDPSNPLESGIEINVHPPGKKPQSISLLSGGEKALTAISLLFAIFKTRPSPFCVLDEVDAPLDDNNILRFTRLVNMFSRDVQFIIVTHNKRTMELADVLYGVTMEKPGVSQIVSVKLKRKPAFEFLEPAPA